MTDDRYMQVQATRSFNEYVQGATYCIDTEDEQMLSLLGAGYFDPEHNPNLVTDQYADAGVVFNVEPGNDNDMAKQEHVNVEAGYQPANEVQVPEKMTGSQRATTAGEETTDGTVGTGSGSDSGDGKRARRTTRQSGSAGDN